MSAETPPIHDSRASGVRRARKRPGGGRVFAPAFFLSLPVLVALSGGVPAQPLRGDAAPGSHAAPGPEASSPRPRVPKDKRTQLEGLFAALKVAPDERSAKMIADRLDQIFTDSGSPGADLLMARADAAAEAKQFDLALHLLDQVILIEPDYIGALSKRATLLYIRDDYGEALADIREVLAREPRHYAMLFGLALIFRELGDETRALAAVRRALAVNPRLDGADELERQLALKAEGRGI